MGQALDRLSPDALGHILYFAFDGIVPFGARPVLCQCTPEDGHWTYACVALWWRKALKTREQQRPDDCGGCMGDIVLSKRLPSAAKEMWRISRISQAVNELVL